MNLKTILGLILVLLLVLTTNLLDKKSFEIVKRSLSNIYEDRLVAYDLTYKMHEELTNRKILLLKGKVGAFTAGRGEFYNNIEETLVEYKATKLTVKEEEYLNKLKNRFAKLKDVENSFLNSEEGIEHENAREQMIKGTNQIVETLNVLAEIQVEEGRRQMILSERAIESGTFMSRVKIICIIIVGLLLQFLLFYEPKRAKLD